MPLVKIYDLSNFSKRKIVYFTFLEMHNFLDSYRMTHTYLLYNLIKVRKKWQIYSI